MTNRARALLGAGLSLIVLAGLRGAIGAEPEWPRTRAERTDYAETSSLADVSAFLDALKAKGAPIVVQTIGRSAGSRPIVAAVVSRPAVADGAAARAAGKLVVYLQANIHGGEVEGKEAVQMFVRDVVSDTQNVGPGRWLDRLVLVVVPVYNVDGNETLGDGPKLRPSQDGPARVGQRPNGAGLDLNRDAIKAVASETRALLDRVYRIWDPHLMLDLHTTNGTRHGYLLTYAPPLNPNTHPAVVATARTMVGDLRRRWGISGRGQLFDYGNVENRPGARGWYTFGDEGRYVTNYVGLRNRLAILSEAASFQPFRTRVEATRDFVGDLVQWSYDHAEEVRAQIDRADADTVAWGTDPAHAPALGVRSEFASRGTEPVPLERLPAATPVDHGKAPDPKALVAEALPIYDHFRVTRTAKLPAAYVLPAGAAELTALLERHGVTVNRLAEPWRGTAERFQVSEAVARRQPFQGGTITRLEGRFELAETTLAAGTLVVPTAQPLGLLAFYLLEPEGLDGAAAWGLLGDLTTPGPYPIIKVMNPLGVRVEPAGSR